MDKGVQKILIGAGSSVLIVAIIVFAPIDPGVCITYEGPDGSKTTKCRDAQLDYDEEKISTLQGLVDDVTELQIQSLQEQNAGEVPQQQIDYLIAESEQEKNLLEVLEPLKYDSFEKEIQDLKNRIIQSSENGLSLEPPSEVDYFYGKWNVAGYYSSGFDPIPYKGEFNFNDDGTFSDSNGVGKDFYGTGIYDYTTLGKPTLQLKKETLNFYFFTIEDKQENSFRATLPFDRANLVFTRN